MGRSPQQDKEIQPDEPGLGWGSSGLGQIILKMRINSGQDFWCGGEFANSS